MPHQWFLIAVFNFCKIVQMALRLFRGTYDTNHSSHVDSQLTTTFYWYCLLSLYYPEPSIAACTVFYLFKHSCTIDSLTFIWMNLILLLLNHIVWLFMINGWWKSTQVTNLSLTLTDFVYCQNLSIALYGSAVLSDLFYARNIVNLEYCFSASNFSSCLKIDDYIFL